MCRQMFVHLHLAVVEAVELGELDDLGRPSRISKRVFTLRADHLLGRDAVAFLGEGAHEVDAAARDDEGPEAVGAQEVEQLDAAAGRRSA